MRNLRIAVCDDDMTDLDSEKQLIEKALLKLGCKYKIDKFSSSEELLGSEDVYKRQLLQRYFPAWPPTG